MPENTFNPTMVRLLRHAEYPLASPAASFQSHNGAIAARGHQPTTEMRVRFQSHNGAIAALLRPAWLTGLLNFQSHNGAIAASRRRSRPTTRCRAFNPTMVRLLRVEDAIREVFAENFQSHNGAIAAVQQLLKTLKEVTFNPTMVRLLRETSTAETV